MKHKLIACLLATVLLPLVAVAKPKPITAKSEIQFGVEMAELGLWSEALFRFEQAEKLGGQAHVVYNNMAVAYEALGAFDKAREYYRKALDAEPTNRELRKNYSRFVEFYQSFNPEGEEPEGEEEAQADGGSPIEPSTAPSAVTSPRDS